MDLHVTEPGGTHIYYDNPTSPTGGELDVDVRCHGNGGLENIVWSVADTPADGTYRYRVDEFEQCGDGPAAWVLEIYVNGTRVRTESGTGDQAARNISVNL
jgi:uncharacterized protein YfaP (DUF2135 family)